MAGDGEEGHYTRLISHDQTNGTLVPSRQRPVGTQSKGCQQAIVDTESVIEPQQNTKVSTEIQEGSEQRNNGLIKCY